MKGYLTSQFGHPRGIVGWLVGQIMAYENRDRIAWTIAKLDIQPDDQLLEIGIGTGLGIELATEQASEGFVAGIDISETMIRQASRRNAALIHAGRVDLRHGDASALPYEANRFDKLIAINSLHHWADRTAGLRESWRVLKPGGRITIVEQPHGLRPEAALKRRGEQILARLSAVGFGEVALSCESLNNGPVIYAIGVKNGGRKEEAVITDGLKAEGVKSDNI